MPFLFAWSYQIIMDFENLRQEGIYRADCINAVLPSGNNGFLMFFVKSTGGESVNQRNCDGLDLKSNVCLGF